MERLAGLGDAGWWVGKVPLSRFASLAAQARVLSVGEKMKDLAEPKRTAMLVCPLVEVRTRARDEFVTMLCTRMAQHLKRAGVELAETGKRQAAKGMTEQLIIAYCGVLAALRDPAGDGHDGTAGAESCDDGLGRRRRER